MKDLLSMLDKLWQEIDWETVYMSGLVLFCLGIFIYKVVDFIFVAQEKKAPYASKIFKMKHEDMEAGWLELDRLLGEYKTVIDGKAPTVYNTPSVVEIQL